MLRLPSRTPNPPTKTIPAKIRWFKLSGGSLVGLGIPSLTMKIPLGSDTLSSRILVWAGHWGSFPMLPFSALGIAVAVLASGRTCVPSPANSFRRGTVAHPVVRRSAVPRRRRESLQHTANFHTNHFQTRIFESKFRDHCAKKLDGALRKPTSFV